ncbi:hypothetical protein ACTL6U_06920 [Rhodovibrionaceae bacterium A322]
MSRATELFDRIKHETNNPPSPEHLSKAADLVMDFSEQAALPNLDALLELADQPASRQSADAASTLAAETNSQSDLLDEEINRFLSLTRSA